MDSLAGLFVALAVCAGLGLPTLLQHLLDRHHTPRSSDKGR